MPSAVFGLGLAYMKVFVILQGKLNNITKTLLKSFHDIAISSTFYFVKISFCQLVISQSISLKAIFTLLMVVYNFRITKQHPFANLVQFL